ncbi:DoxX family membrane protein [Streptomyces smyrnaeus]|uniref:DoxX family membrane protein n=1 Tax=Streptomyces smyrnaeus TaxID=1387713 RepID=UPI0037B93D25
MSVDTRTPRAPGASGRGSGHSPAGSPRGFFDDEPVLSTVKVPSDPAEVVVNHASFRVRLGAASAASATPPTAAGPTPPSAASSPTGAYAALSPATAAAPPAPTWPGTQAGSAAGTSVEAGVAASPAPAGTSASAGTSAPAGREAAAFEDTEPLPVAAGGSASAATRRTGSARTGRRTPVVWSGGREPDDTGATKLIQAARTAGLVGFEGGTATAESDPSATQTLPRVTGPGGPGRAGTGTGAGASGSGPATVVGPPRGPQPSESGRPVPPRPEPPRPEPLLKGVRPARGAFDEDTGELEALEQDTGDLATVAYRGDAPYRPGDGHPDHDGHLDHDGHHRHFRHQDPEDYEGYGSYAGHGADDGAVDSEGRRRRETVRHAYYPGRRMNLGVVLLPLRLFLGFITVYAGMGKLCDPVYFDGGERGSMVTWLRSLDPWTIASPLRDFALAHPVGAGLTVAFLQVIVGVLTMFGLWQRVAAGVGALLSAALLMTVSWSSVPAYEAPDIIYLAAWSPLIIAGAPVYSVDGRLAGEAWRKLGPRVELRDLRRRVLRRGTVIATVVVGLALLIGSLLGSAVRSSQPTTAPERGKTPTNRLPGSPMPQSPGQSSSGQETQGPAGSEGRRGDADRRGKDGRPSANETEPGEGRATSGPESTPSQGRTQGADQGGPQGATTPGRQQGTTAPPAQQQPEQQPQATTGGSTGSRSGLSHDSATTGGGSSGSGGGTSSSGGGSGGRGALGGLLGR